MRAERKTERKGEILAFPALPAAEHGHAHDHAVQFYDDESFLASIVGEFLLSACRRDEPAIVIATPAHRKAFASRLRDAGIDVRVARQKRQLTFLDARETLAKLMVEGRPDPTRFRSVVGGVIERSLHGRANVPVRAYGEMVDLLWKEGNPEGAIGLEALWNDLAEHYEFELLCAYSMGNFYRASDTEAFRTICDQHSRVIPTEHYLRVEDPQKLLAISVLEQRARALQTEIAQRETLEHQLRETVSSLQSEQRDLRDVLENAAEGIHLVGDDGRVVWANAAELEMMGYGAEDYIGHYISEFHVDQLVVADILRRLSAGETLREYPARLRHKSGSIVHVLINSNVCWRDGAFAHTRCFTRDITALQQAADERDDLLARERAARAEAEIARNEAERARLAAEHASRAKSEFLAVMSHELRTPLNAIGGYVELMDLGIQGPVTEHQRDSLEKIQRSQRMLLGLINQVLNYTRVETGTVRYELSDVLVDEMLRSTEALVAPQLRTKGLHFSYSGCDQRITVRSDAEKLQQILLNLLGNAIKFTETGGRLGLTVDAYPSLVAIRISDNGIGIEADKLEAIFDPFVQVDANYTRTRDGVGLGLAISRDLARGMGGELTVVSRPGEGSTFTITLARLG